MTENSAEREAEEIFKAAAAKIQAEDCPQGEACAVHFRNHEEVIEEDVKYARFIDYVGDYAVITDDNHVFDDPQFMIRMLLGLIKEKDLPPQWETTIFLVGEGALAELSEKSLEDRKYALRYAQTHKDWESLQEAHRTVVSALDAGLIDVSKPLDLED